ncbi:MAG: hypothetical protein V1648_01985 [Candidatus Aenigmatarchaeota archaeon]
MLKFIKSGEGHKTMRQIMNHFGWDHETAKEFQLTYSKNPRYIQEVMRMIENTSTSTFEVSFEGENFIKERTEGWKKIIKEKWIEYILFGLITVIISSSITVAINSYYIEIAKGPPCRIYTVYSENTPLSLPKNQSYGLPFLIINMRSEPMIIDKVDALCYWGEIEPIEENLAVLNDSTSDIGQINLLQPQSPPTIPPYQPLRYSGRCKTPLSIGDYKINIKVKTSLGDCQQDINLKVKQ